MTTTTQEMYAEIRRLLEPVATYAANENFQDVLAQIEQIAEPLTAERAELEEDS